MKTKKVLLYLIVSFVVTYFFWGLLSIIKQDDSMIFSNPVYLTLFFIGGISPTLSAYLAILFSDKEFKVFNKSVLKIRVKLGFYIFSITMIFGIQFLSLAIYGYLHEPILSDLSPEFIALIPMIIFMIPFGGLEELGWRGLLLTELIKKFSFNISALIVGIIWGLWHLPLFFIQGLCHYQADFIAFTIHVIGYGLVLAWLFCRTRSIFICIFFHACINAVSSIGLSCPDDGRYIPALMWLIIGTILIFADRKRLNVNGV